MREIHGHEILNLIHEAAKPIERSHLEKSVAERYGDNARFFTCSASRMTLSDLISFLESRDKIRIQEGRITPGSSGSCHSD